MSEYTGRTSLYMRRTRLLVYTLSVQLSTPRVLSELGFCALGFELGLSVGLGVWVLDRPSKSKCFGLGKIIGL